MPCTLCGGVEGVESTEILAIRGICHKRDGNACSACDRLQELETRIKETTTTLKTLLDQRRSMKETINQEHDPFIHRLPPEIASRIFTFTLPRKTLPDIFSGDSLYHEPDLAYERPPPYVLGAVCHRWREIANATPQLWNIISLNLTPENGEKRKDLVKDWLDRSGKLPLYIRIFVREELPPLPLDILGGVIDTLNKTASRWKALDLHIPAAALSLLRNATQETTVLEALHFYPTTHPPQNDNEEYVHPAKFSLGGGSKPILTKLHLETGKLRHIDVDWTNITHFDGAFLHMNDCYHLIEHTPRLYDCRLSCPIGVDLDIDATIPPDSSIRRIRTPMKKLEVDSLPREFWARFLAPHLESLMIETRRGPLSDVINSLRASSCLLRTLHVSLSVGEEADLLVLLRQTTSLERLTIANGLRNLHFFEHLGQTAIFDPDTDPFLPHLQFLEFWGVDLNIIWPGLLKMFPVYNPLATNEDTPRCRPLGVVSFDEYRVRTGRDGATDNEDEDEGHGNDSGEDEGIGCINQETVEFIQEMIKKVSNTASTKTSMEI